MKKQRVKAILSVILCVTLLLSQSITAVYAAEDLLITDNLGTTVMEDGTGEGIVTDGAPATGDPEGGTVTEGDAEPGDPGGGTDLGGDPATGDPEGGTVTEGDAEPGDPGGGTDPGGDPVTGNPEDGTDPGGDPATGGDIEQETGTELMLPNLLLEAGGVEGVTSWYLNDPETATFTISTEAELRYLVELVNGTAMDGETPMAAVDFLNRTITLGADIALTEEWTPIGMSACPFKGTFDGGNHAISGLAITGSSTYQGLFGYINGAVIKDLTVSGSVSGGDYVGGVVASVTGAASELDNVTFSGSVTGGSYVGGLVGRSDVRLKLTGCAVNTGAGDADNVIKSTGEYGENIGGLVGYVNGDAVLDDCSAGGSVGTTEDRKNYTGGIAGWLNGQATVAGCSNAAAVYGNNQAGGIVGSVQNAASFTDCSNSGTINAGNYSGGIVGQTVNTADFTGCSNTAAINGNQRIGGIVGSTHNTTTLTDCANGGTITATSSIAAGIVGNTTGGSGVTVTRCSNTDTGAVTAASYVGGIIGLAANVAAITDCFNTAVLTGTADAAYMGGIASRLNGANSSITHCHNSGAVTRDTASGSPNLGGILGFTNQASVRITDCYNTGHIDVTAEAQAQAATGGAQGGIAGFFYSAGGRIERCFNSGPVTGGYGTLGGIAGDSSNAVTFADCVNSGAVSGGMWSFPAGISGNSGNTAAVFKNVMNYGTITFIPDPEAPEDPDYGGTYSFAYNAPQGVTYIDCYTLAGCANSANDPDGIIMLTAEQFASGEATWMLDRGEGEVWAQYNGFPAFKVVYPSAQYIYKILLPETTNGTVQAESLYFPGGAPNVKLTATPAGENVLLYLHLTSSTDTRTVSAAQNGHEYTFTMPYGNVIVEAAFGSAPTGTYTVSFKDSDGETAFDGIANQTVGVEQGYRATAPTPPVKDGKEFKGWYLDGTPYDFRDIVTRDITLCAKWKSADGILVTMHTGLHTEEQDWPDFDAETDSDGYVTATIEIPEWKPNIYDSYEFLGWFTRPVGGKLVDLATTRFTEDTDIYAHWRRSDVFENSTQAHPYVIADEDALCALASHVNEGREYPGSYIELGADIALTGGEWTAIGTSGTPFAGSFDGKGYTVSGMFIGALGAPVPVGYQGLFGNISGTVKNLNVTGEIFAKGDYAGGVVGYSAGVLENLTFAAPSSDASGDEGEGDGDGEVPGIVSSTGNYVGGVAGYAFGTLKDCANYGTVSGGDYVGGVVGATKAGTSFTSSLPASEFFTANYGAVSGKNEVGGILGGVPGDVFLENGSDRIIFTRIVNDGAVTGTGQFVGGFFGGSTAAFAGTVDCVNYGNVTGASYVGGFAGALRALYTTGTTGDNINNSDVSASGQYVGGAVGYTTGHNYRRVSEQQSQILERVNFEYVGNTGDVSGTGKVGGLIGCLDGAFTPVVQFCWSTGDVTGESNSDDVAGLVGFTARKSSVSKSYVTGKVVNNGLGTATGVVNGYGANGSYQQLLYYNAETPLDTGAPEASNYSICYYLAPDGPIPGAKAQPITPEQAELGIVPYLMNNKAAGYWAAGDGGEGSLPFKLTRAANNRICLVTIAPLSTESRLTVRFADSVKASVPVAGSQFAIASSGTAELPLEVTIRNPGDGETPVFEPSNLVQKDGSIYTIKLANADALIVYSLPGDELSENWYSDANTTFTLYSEAQLRGFAALVNSGKDFSGKTVKLGADIELTGPWTPVGSLVLNEQESLDDENSKLFAGTFDGQGHKITNLSVGTDESGYAGNGAGMFAGIAATGAISNLNLDNVNIDISGDYVGALAGYIAGKAASVTVTAAQIEGGSYVGGVVGYARDVAANPAAQLDTLTFGAAADTDESSVTGSGDFVGGIAGYSYYVSVSGSNKYMYNYGDVTGRDYVGGIAGGVYADKQNVVAINGGDISGRNYVGGIIGHVQDSDNTWLYLPFTNSGDVTAGGDCAGGFIGYVGGLVYGPMTNSTIHVHINSGNVTAAGSYAGGIIGQMSEGKLNIGYANYGFVRNDGNVTAADYAGGILGASPTASIRHFGNTGAVTVTATGGKSGGLLGGLTDGAATAEIISSYTKTALSPSGAAQTIYANAYYLGAAGTPGLTSVEAGAFTSGKLSWLLEQGETAPETAYYWAQDGVAPVRAVGTYAGKSYARLSLTDPNTRENMAASGWLELSTDLVLRTTTYEWMRVNPPEQNPAQYGWQALTDPAPTETIEDVPIYSEGNTYEMYLPAEVNKEIKPPGSGTIGERRTAVSSLLSPLQNKLQPPYSAAFTPGNAVDAGTLALSFTPSGVAPRLDLAYNVGAAIAPDYDWYRTLEGEEGSKTVTVRPSPYVVTTEAELIGLSNLAFGTAELNPEAAGTRTKDDFLGDTVYLGANIELKSPGWTPIGTSTNFFAGTFDGNYGGESTHSITGLFVSTNVIDAGLFGYTNGASIKNITVRGRVTSTANNAHIGGVVGYAVATAFENVVFGAEGDTSAVVYRPSASTAGYIGGIAGWAQCAVANSVVVFKNCVNYGEVTAVTSNASYAGGIVSMMNTSSPEGTLVFDGCQNYGDVAATAIAANQAAYAAGLVYQNSKGTLVLLDCQNFGDVAVDVAVNSAAAATATASGLVGFGQIQKQFAYGGADYDCSLYIKNCENHGNIESTLNVAGAAWQLWAVSRIDGFTNYGDITVRTKAAAGTAVSPVAAGVFGYVNANVTDVTINNCTNNGAVRADVSASTSISTGVRAGGIGGYTETLYSERYLTMTGCVNNGGVTVVGPKANMSAANYVGGLLGQVALSSNFSGRVTFERCGNTEDITVVADPAATLRSYAAGILAYLQYNGANPVRVTGCSNTGDISSPGELPASGIVNVYGSGNILKISASFSTGAVTGDAPYGVSNVTSQAMVDTCYYVPGAAGGDKTAKAWSGGFDSMEFAGRLNRAAGCADIWAKGDPVPVHADGDNAIRNLMLAWSSVDKNGEPSTASNTVSVTGNREIGSDGVIYASKNASLTMVFNTAPNYILQLLTLKDGGGAELLADSNLTSMPFALGAPAVTATALFAAKDPALTPPFTVGFDLGGAPGPVPDAQSVDGYGKAVEPTPPVWADYLFLGWYTPDGSKWHFAGAVMRPMTLTARWHDGFRVIFDYNYDVGPAPDTQLVRYGEAVTPPADPTRPILNEGNYDEVRYKFQGWSTQATGGDKWDFSTVVAKGDPRLVPADPIPQLTLYAQWEEIQGEYAFEVIFYPNYPGATTTSDKFGFDTAVTRPANPVRPPVMAGDEILTEYEFLGWFPYVGAGSNSVFKPQFDFETIITEENINNYSTYGYSGVIELYAQWEATSRLPDAATIEIDSAEILPAVAEMVDGGIGFEGKTLILTQDITIDGNVWNPTLGGTIPMDLATGFRGTLTAAPGVTLTLENLRRPLFLKIGAAGTVDGLTITGSYTSLPSERIMSSRGSLQSGGITSEHGLLAAYNEGTITNCVLQNARITMIDPVTTTAVYDVGGLVGKNSGTIADCSAENCEIELILETTFVDFSGGSNDDKISAGTLVGYSTKPLVNLAVTGGSVIATDIGVPMNSNLSDIFGGYTAGFMSQTEWYAIGGIAGKSAGGENCVNDGCEVNGGFIAGGVFGTQPYDTPETGNIISGCENSGTVKGYLGAGGVVGFVNYETVVSRCKNTGEIGNTQAGQTFIQGAFGGVVGLATFTVVIENCVNGEQGQKITVPNQIYNWNCQIQFSA